MMTFSSCVDARMVADALVDTHLCTVSTRNYKFKMCRKISAGGNPKFTYLLEDFIGDCYNGTFVDDSLVVQTIGANSHTDPVVLPINTVSFDYIERVNFDSNNFVSLKPLHSRTATTRA